MKKFSLEFKIPVSVIREEKKYIAYTPALDLSTSASSYEEVKKRFREAVNIFFEEIVKKGTLKEVLQELGWKRVETGWNAPVVISQESQLVRIPAK